MEKIKISKQIKEKAKCWISKKDVKNIREDKVLFLVRAAD
jgi:hypothetical protein